MRQIINIIIYSFALLATSMSSHAQDYNAWTKNQIIEYLQNERNYRELANTVRYFHTLRIKYLSHSYTQEQSFMVDVRDSDRAIFLDQGQLLDRINQLSEGNFAEFKQAANADYALAGDEFNKFIARIGFIPEDQW